MSTVPIKLATFVGSPHDKICSVGAFARAEHKAFLDFGWDCELIEPGSSGEYPDYPRRQDFDVGMVHLPSLHDRKNPLNTWRTMVRLRWLYPGVKFLINVHEFSEAPLHWRWRIRGAAKLSHGIVVNTTHDQQALQMLEKPILRCGLGPTLWNESLLTKGTPEKISQERAAAKSRLTERLVGKINFDKPMVLHPGLLTPGKGLEFIAQWLEARDKSSLGVNVVIMGAFGPKQKDHLYASAVLKRIQNASGDQFIFIDSPADDIYKDVLVASDLIIFPYDNGLSERRSTFLSAASCGAHVWAFASRMSNQMNLDKSGASLVDKDAEFADKAKSLEVALGISLTTQVLEHRFKNLQWAKDKGWSARVNRLSPFINNIIGPKSIAHSV